MSNTLKAALREEAAHRALQREERYKRIRALAADGLSVSEIVARLGVNDGTVVRVLALSGLKLRRWDGLPNGAPV